MFTPDLAALIEDVRDVVFRTDEAGRWTFLNGAWSILTGFSVAESLGTLSLDYVHPDDRERHRALFHLAGGQNHALHQLRYLRKQGGVRWVEVHARVTVEDDHVAGATGTLRDVTDRRRIEARLMEADRMIAVGTLAVGVAHEINNPLAYVIGNLQWAEAALASSPYAAPDGPLADLRRALGDAAEGADRVRRIVRDLKALARSDDGVRQPVHLPAVIESAASICHSEIHHRARLVRELASTPAVLGNEGKIAQVLVNLLVNAAQAIPEGDPRGNSIWIRTSCEGDRVALEVADTGCGIAPEHLPRIFDPFFTTKPPGQGTGLGLAICRTTVAALGGEITVESERGRGARFRVLLPAAAPAVAARTARVEGRTAKSRLLLVDDEPLVLSALRRMLSRQHEVTACGSGLEALERMRRGERYDALLCDLTMPDVSGMDLHGAIAKLDPAQASRMVFMSGGTFTPEAEAFLERVPNPRVGKPFDAAELAAALRAVQPDARTTDAAG